MQINIEEIAVAGFCLMFFWIGTGIYKVIRSQYYINEWDEYESQVNQQSGFYKRYA